MKRLIISALFALGATAAMPSFALTQADHIGQPGSPEYADRTIPVSSDTRSINVNSGETVNLDVQGKQIPWDFDGVDSVVKLRDLVPGAPDANVYVAQANNHFAP
jgi:hypothetical protein